AADPSVSWGRPTSLATRGPAGIGRPTSDRTQRVHRGTGGGMSAHGDPTQHGEPRAMVARGHRPGARDGQAGPRGGDGGGRSTVETGYLRWREGASVQDPGREGGPGPGDWR